MFDLDFTNFEAIFFKNNLEIARNRFQNDTKKRNCINFLFLEYHTFLDLENEIFQRENDEFLFTLDLKNKKCTIFLKKEEAECFIDVDDCTIEKEENKITLEYIIESDDTKNKLVIEKR